MPRLRERKDLTDFEASSYYKNQSLPPSPPTLTRFVTELNAVHVGSYLLPPLADLSRMS